MPVVPSLYIRIYASQLLPRDESVLKVEFSMAQQHTGQKRTL
jgi:hypothetical protein